ncbi:MAG: hypothetical protein O3B76_04990 [Proteobacteria bacterium]|nr:hypothetical protein [Pseudomonadota bacterium]MDA1022015.1 hypothetical protein [Pseudomonadota bacterium]
MQFIFLSKTKYKFEHLGASPSIEFLLKKTGKEISTGFFASFAFIFFKKPKPIPKNKICSQRGVFNGDEVFGVLITALEISGKGESAFRWLVTKKGLAGSFLAAPLIDCRCN